MTALPGAEWNVIGAVLAGGASRRMGRPKAEVRLDGVTLLQRAASALRQSGCHQVLVVGGDPSWAERSGLVHLPDRWPGQGPLGGIATAVFDGPAAIAEPRPQSAVGAPTVVVVVACDQPLLTATALRSLVQALVLAADGDARAGSSRPVIAVACGGDGRLQPFPSVWPVHLGGALVAAFESGERRADAGFALAERVCVPLDDDILVDVDTPADLERLTRIDRDRR